MQGTNWGQAGETESQSPTAGSLTSTRGASQLHKKKQCLVIKALIKASARAMTVQSRRDRFSPTGGTIGEMNPLGRVGAWRCG